MTLWFWTHNLQASLSFIISWSFLKLSGVCPLSWWYLPTILSSNHLIFYHPLLLLPSIFLSIMIFSNELATFTSGGQSIVASASVLRMVASSAPLLLLLWLIIFMPDRGYGYHSQGFLLTQVQSQSLWFLSPKCSHNLSLSDYPQILYHWSSTLSCSGLDYGNSFLLILFSIYFLITVIILEFRLVSCHLAAWRLSLIHHCPKVQNPSFEELH